MSVRRWGGLRTKSSEIRWVLSALIVGVIAVSGCIRSGVAVAAATGAVVADQHSSSAVSYDHNSSAVVIAYSRTAPYNPQDQGTGSRLEVYGDGRVVTFDEDGRGTRRIDEPQLQAVLQQMWDDGLFDTPDLGERIYDAGEQSVVATANARTAELTISSASSSKTLAVAALMTAIQTLHRNIH